MFFKEVPSAVFVKQYICILERCFNDHVKMTTEIMTMTKNETLTSEKLSLLQTLIEIVIIF